MDIIYFLKERKIDEFLKVKILSKYFNQQNILILNHEKTYGSTFEEQLFLDISLLFSDYILFHIYVAKMEILVT